MTSTAAGAQARALWFTGPGKAALQTELLPAPSPDVCVVRSLYSAVSAGTERLVLGGRVPEELRQSMRVPYMGGDFAFPVKYGYSLVGRVEDGPESLIGKTVHLLHPHQDLCFVSSSDVFVVPDDVPAHRAVLASNLETAVTALWDARPTVGERALIVGFGCVGALIAQLLRGVPGIELTVVDADESRRALAASLGYRTHAPGGEAEFDLAFHATGTSAGLQEAIDRVAQEGRIVEVSWYGNDEVSLRLGGTFHSMRKTLLSTQVSNIPALQSPRWDRLRRKRLVFELLKDSSFDALLGAPIDFDQLPRFFMAPPSPRPLVPLVQYR